MVFLSSGTLSVVWPCSSFPLLKVSFPRERDWKGSIVWKRVKNSYSPTIWRKGNKMCYDKSTGGIGSKADRR
jgi:hypothetical protein